MADQKAAQVLDVTPNMAEAVLELMKGQQAVLEKLGENTKPYEPEFGSPAYEARLRAEGHYDTFPIPVFQNGREAEPKGLPAQTRERASALRSGTYWGGKLTVENTGKAVHLKYKSVSVEDRMRQPWKSFADLIDGAFAEMTPA
jgi:hypothetical protein